MEGSRVAPALLFGVLLDSARGDVARCTDDTFGLAGEDYPLPFERGVESLRCDFAYEDPARIPTFDLNHYASLDDFANFRGTDMVPETHFEYERRPAWYNGLRKWVPGQNGPKAQTRRIRLATCQIPQDDGGAYSIQRIGPLVSTGNYDYWQAGWPDLWKLSSALKAHPEGIMLTSTFSGPVDPNSRVLGYPPIHIHHVHIMPSPQRVSTDEECLKLGHELGEKPDMCESENIAFEQHGDYQCTERDGGVDCFFEKTPAGHAKLLQHTLDIKAELNDVRAPDSEPITWYYQLVLRWFPRTTEMKPLSQLYMAGPGHLVASDQRTRAHVFPVDARASSLYWYTGTMPRDGELIRNKLHGHNTMFRRAFFFHAAPHDLGLDDERFWPKLPYQPLLLEDLPFRDFQALEDFLLAKLAGAEKRWDAACPPSQPSCAAGRPGLSCEAWVSTLQLVDPRSGKSFAYDRRAPTCCRPRPFRKGGPFTVVGFTAPMTTAPGPWMPDEIPARGHMHVHWIMAYRSRDNESHYATTVCSQSPGSQWGYAETVTSSAAAVAAQSGSSSASAEQKSLTESAARTGAAEFGTSLRTASEAAATGRAVGGAAGGAAGGAKIGERASRWPATVLGPFWREAQGGLAMLFLTLGVFGWHAALRCRRARHRRSHVESYPEQGD